MNIYSLSQKLLVKSTFVLLVLFCFNLLISRANLLYLYDSKRAFVVGLVIIAALLLLFFRQARQQTVLLFSSLTRPVKIACGLFLLFSLLAKLLSQYRVSAFTSWFYLAGLVLMLPMFYNQFKSHRYTFIRLAIVMNVLLFFTVAVAFWIVLSQHSPVSTKIFFGFSNPRFINQVQIWLILPVAYLAVRSQSRKRLALAPLLVISLAFAVCITLNGRGVILSLLSGFVLMAFVDRRCRWLWIRTMLYAFFAGLVIALVFLNPLPSYLLGIDSQDIMLRTTTSDRLALWSQALSITSFLGAGGGAFVCHDFAFGRPHNSLLNVWVHWGVIPTVCYIFLSLSLLYKVVSSSSRLVKVLGANVLTGLLYSLVSGVLDSPLSQLLAVMSLAVFWASLKSPLRPVHPKLITHVTLMVLMSAVIWACSYRLYDRWEHYPQRAGEIVDVAATGIKTQFWLGYNCLENRDLP